MIVLALLGWVYGGLVSLEDVQDVFPDSKIQQLNFEVGNVSEATDFFYINDSLFLKVYPNNDHNKETLEKLSVVTNDFPVLEGLQVAKQISHGTIKGHLYSLQERAKGLPLDFYKNKYLDLYAECPLEDDEASQDNEDPFAEGHKNSSSDSLTKFSEMERTYGTILENFGSLLAAMQRQGLSKPLIKLSEMESLWVHGDLHVGNVLYDPASGFYLVDNGTMGKGPVLNDTLTFARETGCIFTSKNLLKFFKKGYLSVLGMAWENEFDDIIKTFKAELGL